VESGRVRAAKGKGGGKTKENVSSTLKGGEGKSLNLHKKKGARPRMKRKKHQNGPVFGKDLCPAGLSQNPAEARKKKKNGKRKGKTDRKSRRK